MIRLDRLATVHISHPLKCALGNGRPGGLPILMYHGIRARLDGRRPYYETVTSPSVFAEQMRFLREKDYTVLSLDDAVARLQSGGPFEKQAVLTFDDGFRDFFTDAYPVLAENRFPATLYLATGRIGDQRVQLEGNEYLTWGEVRELRAHGIAIGSHTVSHPELKNLTEAEIDRELGDSKRMIEDKLGAPVKSFAYPYAFPENDRHFAERLEAMLESNGYENGVCTILGRATSRHSRFFLPRLPVNNWDDARLVKAKLEGGYDWLHVPQVLSKAVKGKARFPAKKRDSPRKAAL
jgi:peptidoglycan/xylan/chitin deacetylase (PgdA/CDA1 family)